MHVVQVSIHAPTGGATRAVPLAGPNVRCFNSRAHGGRDNRLRAPHARHCVSIHAPTGGATESTAITHPPMSFNSRAHGGRDKEYLCEMWYKDGFNSRAHGGRDFRTADDSNVQISFNSRAHGGRDLVCRIDFAGDMFQFTRPRGARPLAVVDRVLLDFVSIHAPTGGATFPVRAQFVAE